MCILSNTAKFSAAQTLLPARNFSATMASIYHLSFGGFASPKCLVIANMPRITVSCDCRLGNARRAVLVAILLDNCHPSSFSLF